jgi:hypothetical protein
VVSVQQWEIAPQLERVAGLRRTAVAYAAGRGVVGGVLADLAIGVSAVLANVVRSSRYVGSSAPVSVSVDVAEDRVLARVRGPRAQAALLDNPGAALGLVIAASLACDIRVSSSGTTGTEISMRFPRAPMPATAPVPHGRFSSAERESAPGAAHPRTAATAASGAGSTRDPGSRGVGRP